jgi:hypothetical protein
MPGHRHPPLPAHREKVGAGVFRQGGRAVRVYAPNKENDPGSHSASSPLPVMPSPSSIASSEPRNDDVNFVTRYGWRTCAHAVEQALIQ